MAQSKLDRENTLRAIELLIQGLTPAKEDLEIQREEGLATFYTNDALQRVTETLTDLVNLSKHFRD